MEFESLTNLIGATLDVKCFAKMTFGVEELRPEKCEACGVGAGMPGNLRIHGHGLRGRTAWGPAEASGAKGELIDLVLRRYRCLECKHVMTNRPGFLARYFRYTTAAIGLALFLWAVARLSTSAVRGEVSPWSIRGLCEPERWRSLTRWLERSTELFGFEDSLGETGRPLASRVAHLLAARAPPELDARARTFVGAQLR